MRGFGALDSSIRSGGDLKQMEAVVPIRDLESVREQPEARLTRWKVVRISTRDGSVQADVAYGWDPCAEEGRLSTRIVSFNSIEQTAVTLSGRRYRFIGRPGHCPDGECAFLRRFGAVLNQCEIKDVSDLYARPRARSKQCIDSERPATGANERKG